MSSTSTATPDNGAAAATSSSSPGTPAAETTTTPTTANDNTNNGSDTTAEAAAAATTTNESGGDNAVAENSNEVAPASDTNNNNNNNSENDDSENENDENETKQSQPAANNSTTTTDGEATQQPVTEEQQAPPAAAETTTEVPPLPRVENNRPLLKMSFSRKRSTFGRYIQHTQYDAADSYRFCTSFVDPKFVTRRLERDFGAQNVKAQKTIAVQTPRYRKVNKMSQCETVITDNVSYDKNSLDDFMTNAQEKINTVLKRNSKFKLFEDDFADLATEDVVGTKSTNRLKKGDQTYTHMDNKNKKISCLDWQPKTKGVVAFAVVDPRPYEERILSYGKAQSSYIVVWNFVDPIYPQVVLEAPSDVMCFKFHPSNPNIVVAGLINGQVAMWDLSTCKEGQKQLKWCQSSLIELSHKASVNDLQWILHKQMKNDRLENNSWDSELSENCFQFMTIGADGKLIIWDIRIDNLKSIVQAGIRKNEKLKGAWIPYHTMNLHQMDGATEVTGQSLYLFQENPYQFVCTSQEGDFLQGDWTPRIVTRGGDEDTTLEEEDQTNRKEKPIITHSFRMDANGGHFGAANSVDRHPQFHDFFLTTGDWSFKIWKRGAELTRPVFSSPYSDITSFVTCGKWSPTRPGVLFAGKSDGKLEVWDFLDKSHEASMVFTINTQASITSINFRVGTGASKYSVTICAVGTSVGTLHVVEMPRNLIKPQNAEQQLMEDFLKREEECVQYYTDRWAFHTQRLDEIRHEQDAQEKRQAEKKKNAKGANPDEPDYNAMTEKFLTILKRYEENQERLLGDEEEEES